MRVFGKNQFLTAVVAVVIAAGAGHMMQNSAAGMSSAAPIVDASANWTPIPTRMDSPLTGRIVASARLVPEPTVESHLLHVPHPTRETFEVATLPSERLKRITAPMDDMLLPPGDDEMNLDGFGMGCAADASASAAHGGMILLELMESCAPDQLVEIAYADLSFRIRLDEMGRRQVELPAFSEQSVVTVRFGDDDPIRLSAHIPDAGAYHRVALAWRGAGEMSIHALEFGAGPGRNGHVSVARSNEGIAPGVGRIVALGDVRLAEYGRAEIYSFPADSDSRQGTIRLSVALRVTAQTCGRPLPVEVIRSDGVSDVDRTQLEISVPGCDAEGDILVLKNLLEDLQFAGN